MCIRDRVTHVKTTTKFGGQVPRVNGPPFIPPKPLGRTSSLSQWRAFQRLSEGPIKLSSQNLARISSILNFTKNVKFGDKGGVASVTWPTFKFRDSLNISIKAKARNLKFGTQSDYKEFYHKMQNWWEKGAWPRSRDLLLNFGTPSISL